jgi:DNA-binding response OmpR family regulator
MSKILVVEDNSELADNICIWLANEQHNVDWVSDGVEAIKYLKAYEYDAIVLDWTLPRMTGIEILKQFRATGGVTPVIMLTGRREIEDKESGFDAGADDYLTKPFEMRELSVRIRNVLRRAATPPTALLKVANIVLDKQARRVTKDGQELKLMPKDFAILELLMTYPNKVFSPESLIERIWSSDAQASAEVVRKHINRIRSQIDGSQSASLIRTVHGIGYSLAPESMSNGPSPS